MLLERLWDSGKGVLSTQVLQSYASTFAKKPTTLCPWRKSAADSRVFNLGGGYEHPDRSSGRLIRDALQDFLLGCVDSSSSRGCGASILYSEDLAAGQIYGAIQVVNPLIDPVTP